jgi:RNA polymerase sigma factor (sigma-70 family)
MQDNFETEDRFRHALLHNERTGLNELYKDLFPKIRVLCSPQLDTDDAKEVLQEAIILVYQKLQNGTFESREPVKNYIYGVCRVLVKKQLHQNAKSRVTLMGDEAPILEDEDNIQSELLVLERYKLYQDKLALLGERCQQLLVFYLQKLTVVRIKEIMGYASEEAVKQQKFKCKKQLIDYCRRDPRFRSLSNQ